MGNIELRGLDVETGYTAYDYVNKIELGSISGNNPVIQSTFSGSLLVAVYPND